jgi:hypothetical protein
MAEFCGLVMKAVERQLTVSPWMTGSRRPPNLARGHVNIDSHLSALRPKYFKRLYRQSKETFLELATLITPRLGAKEVAWAGKDRL